MLDELVGSQWFSKIDLGVGNTLSTFMRVVTHV